MKKQTKAEKRAKRQEANTIPVGQAEPAPNPVAEVEPAEPTKKPFIQGRTLRAYVGFGMILLVCAVFGWDHFVLRRSFEALEITGQALLIGVGLLLIDKKLYKEFKGAVLSRIGKK